MDAHTYPHEVLPTGGSAAFAAGLRAHLPVLETDRMVLRAPKIEDFELFRAIDPSNTRSVALAERAASEFDEPVLVHRHAPREVLQ